MFVGPVQVKCTTPTFQVLALRTRYKVQAILEMLFVGLLQVSRHYLNLVEVPIKCKLLEAGTGGSHSQLDSGSNLPDILLASEHLGVGPHASFGWRYSVKTQLEAFTIEC